MPATTSQENALKSKKTKQKENREQKTGTHTYRGHKVGHFFFQVNMTDRPYSRDR